MRQYINVSTQVGNFSHGLGSAETWYNVEVLVSRVHVGLVRRGGGVKLDEGQRGLKLCFLVLAGSSCFVHRSVNRQDEEISQ